MTEFPKHSSIYWFDPEPVIGSVIRKIRPYIVISPNEMNEHLNTVIVAPHTSNLTPWSFRLTIDLLKQKSSIACDQIRAVDKTRLRSRISNLSSYDKNRLYNLIQTMFSE